MAKVIDEARRLGISNLKIEQPSKKQIARLSYNILANVSFNLLIDSEITVIDAAENEVPDYIRLSGVQLVKNDSGEKRVYTPRINGFYPVGVLGRERERFLFEAYESIAKKWAEYPEMADVNELDINSVIDMVEDEELVKA